MIRIMENPELNEAQRAELKRLEGQIKKGQEAFFATCKALVEIEAKKLYVPNDSIFVYAAHRWDFTPSDVCRFKAAAKVLEILDGFGTLPTNEGQARELAKLKDRPEALRQVWRNILEDDEKITAAVISTGVKRHLGQDQANRSGRDVEPEAALPIRQEITEEAIASPVSEIIFVVQSLQAIVRDLEEVDLDDDSRVQLSEQLGFIDDLAWKIRSRLSLSGVGV